MQQVALEKLVKETRAQVAETRNAVASILRFRRRLPPLKLANIKLSGIVRPPNPMYEVVAPVGRRLADPVKLFRLLEGPPRRTFGRGELKLV